MRKDRDWLDNASDAANVAGYFQLEGLKDRVDESNRQQTVTNLKLAEANRQQARIAAEEVERTRIEKERAAKEKTEDALREIVFRASKQLSFIEEHLGTSSPKALYLARHLEGALQGISTASFRSTEDKEQVYALQQRLAKVISGTKKALDATKTEDVEKCLRYEAEIEPLNFLAAFQQENEGRTEKLKAELDSLKTKIDSAKAKMDSGTVRLSMVKTESENLRKTIQKEYDSLPSWIKVRNSLVILSLSIGLICGALLLLRVIFGKDFSGFLMGASCLLTVVGGMGIAQFKIRNSKWDQVSALQKEATALQKEATALQKEATALEQEAKALEENAARIQSQLSGGAVDHRRAKQAEQMCQQLSIPHGLPSVEYNRMLRFRQEFIANVNAALLSPKQDSQGVDQAEPPFPLVLDLRVSQDSHIAEGNTRQETPRNTRLSPLETWVQSSGEEDVHVVGRVEVIQEGSTVAINCPRCGHRHSVDSAKLDSFNLAIQPIKTKDEYLRLRESNFRFTCNGCNGRFLVLNGLFWDAEFYTDDGWSDSPVAQG